jgi:hypothetical protein
MQDVRGYNPYKFGMAGSADSHNSGAPYRQDNYYGGHGEFDGTTQVRMAGHNSTGFDIRMFNPALA